MPIRKIFPEPVQDTPPQKNMAAMDSKGVR